MKMEKIANFMFTYLSNGNVGCIKLCDEWKEMQGDAKFENSQIIG